MAAYGGASDHEGNAVQGELNFQQFAERVMGSSKTDGTSVGHYKRAATNTSNDDGNSDQFLRRKVQEAWKPLRMAFKHASDGQGMLPAAAFKDVLYHADIVLQDDAFDRLIKQMQGMSKQADGRIKAECFLQIYGKGTASNRDVLSTIKNISCPRPPGAVKRP
jgi:hypothetical protein